MWMYIDWFDTERISTGKISIVGATAPHTSSSRGGIKLVVSVLHNYVLKQATESKFSCSD